MQICSIKDVVVKEKLKKNEHVLSPNYAAIILSTPLYILDIRYNKMNLFRENALSTNQTKL